MLSSGKGFSFCYQEKLHLDRDFDTVLKNGKKITSAIVNIFVFNRQDGNEISRFGLITSKKVGSAVERNRAKRRLREIFRTNKHKLTPGLDMIFMLKPEIKLTGYGKIEQTVLGCLKSAKFYNDI